MGLAHSIRGVWAINGDPKRMRVRYARRRGIWPFRWEQSFYRIYESYGGSVWHDVVTGERPGTLIEGKLSDVAWLVAKRKRVKTA